MNTTTPYSDQWRERTLARLGRTSAHDLAAQTGLDLATVLHALYGPWPRDSGGEVSLEIVGPIDELLGKLEADAEDRALDEQLLAAEVETSSRNGRADFEPIKLRRVNVDLGKLCDVDLRKLCGFDVAMLGGRHAR